MAIVQTTAVYLRPEALTGFKTIKLMKKTIMALKKIIINDTNNLIQTMNKCMNRLTADPLFNLINHPTKVNLVNITPTNTMTTILFGKTAIRVMRMIIKKL